MTEQPTTTPDPTTQPDPLPLKNKQIASPVTLRITAAEVLDSQLSEEDLQVLGIHTISSDDSSGGPANPVKCASGYTKCETAYSDEAKIV